MLHILVLLAIIWLLYAIADKRRERKERRAVEKLMAEMRRNAQMGADRRP